MRKKFSRRGANLALTLFLFACVGTAASQSNCDIARTPLKSERRGLDMDVGVATQYKYWKNSADKKLIRSEFNVLVAENELKMENIMLPKDAPGTFTLNVTEVKQMYTWAKRAGMKVRGHPLIYHAALPQKVYEWQMSQDEWRAWAKNYMCAVMREFRGIISEYDVINEAFWIPGFDMDGGSSNGKGFRQTFLLEKLGEDYIPFLFRAARQCDPSAKLYINDYLIEYVNAKSDFVFQQVKRWKRQGVPIDGVGLQGHLNYYFYGSDQMYKNNFARFQRAGIPLAFTELDIFHECKDDIDHFQVQAELYYRFVRWSVRYGFSSIVLWGLLDSQSWINDNSIFPCKGDPLLFDSGYRKKLAYQRFQEALCDEKREPGGFFRGTTASGGSGSGVDENDFSAQFRTGSRGVRVFGADFNVRTTGGPSRQHAWNLWSNGYVETAFNLRNHRRVVVELFPRKAGGEDPMAKIYVNNMLMVTQGISNSPTVVTVETGPLSGLNKVKIEYTNDFQEGGQDRDLEIDQVTWFR